MAEDHPTGQSGLYQAFLQLKTPEQCYGFLQEVCSYTKLSAMEQRYILPNCWWISASTPRSWIRRVHPAPSSAG